MKKTVEIDSWSIWDLVDEAGHEDSICTIAQLIKLLRAVDERQPEGLDNLRLIAHFDDHNDESRLRLVGDRDETIDEATERERLMQKHERMELLRQLADQHQPQMRYESDHNYHKRRSDLIHSRGWDTLAVEDLRKLVQA